jgi:hypothetical protein
VGGCTATLGGALRERAPSCNGKDAAGSLVYNFILRAVPGVFGFEADPDPDPALLVGAVCTAVIAAECACLTVILFGSALEAEAEVV